MRLTRTNLLTPGLKLAQTIRNENGIILIQQGVILTNKMIHRLQNLGISYVYIEDERTEGIVIQSTLSNELRIEAINEIKSLFQQVNTDQLTNKSYILNKQDRNLANIIEKIIDEVNEKDVAISMLADILVTDNYTFQHSLNVALYSISLGKQLNLTTREIFELGIGALLHDIGKVYIDEDILKKPGQLTDEEFKLMQSHTELGFNYIRKHTDYSSVIAHCAYQHHERLDGSGYPRQLKCEEIHTYAKVIGIADVFDAVTSNRVYRNALLPHEGLEILYADAVYKFDKNMVELFKKSVTVYPNGLTVQLSDGRMAVVAEQNSYLCDRPIVRILQEGSKEVEPYDVDLARHGDITIQSHSLVG